MALTLRQKNSAKSEAAKIFVNISSKSTVTFTMQSSEKIKNIKFKLQDKEGIPLHRQLLVFAGMQLEDRRTLSDYNIKDEETLNLIL